jgi:hypothetical protein
VKTQLHFSWLDAQGPNPVEGAPPRLGGDLPQPSLIVGVGAPFRPPQNFKP